MNETIVKTEKLTELKNLVSEIEEFKNKKDEIPLHLLDVKKKQIRENKQKLYELIKAL